MLIGISGMISSGKSTLTTKLVKEYKNSLMLEEFEENDEVFNTFLKWLYNKKPNLTIGFQSFVVENHTSKLFQTIEKFKEKGYSFKNNHLFLDRFSIEHYIFANVNLKPKGPKYLAGYDALFRHLITEDETPDLAIYLDMSFETFKKRLFARGRNVEIENWNKNVEYFKELYDAYKPLFLQQAKKYNLDYVIIETDNMSEDEVFAKTKEIIDTFDFSKKKRYLL